jgi:6-phosphogluconolactonase
MLPITAPRQMSTAKNYEELCLKAVEKILTLVHRAIHTQGRCTIVLSGGSTPQGVYSLMATRPYCDQFDWEKIHFFLGDERWVPRHSPRSNYKMIMDSLFSQLNPPSYNFHPIKTNTHDVAASASLYEKELVHFFALKPNEFPRFDLVLLGLGQDGHTASLIPDNPAINESTHLAVPVEAKGYEEKRVTLTLPVLNQAKAVFFLVSGPDKAQVLQKILEGKNSFPAGKVNPQQGEITWFLDQQAASLLGLHDEK